jgi:hypothetical protein
MQRARRAGILLAQRVVPVLENRDSSRLTSIENPFDESLMSIGAIPT